MFKEVDLAILERALGALGSEFVQKILILSDKSAAFDTLDDETKKRAFDKLKEIIKEKQQKN